MDWSSVTACRNWAGPPKSPAISTGVPRSGLSRICCNFELKARDKLQRSGSFEHFPEFVAGPARDCFGPSPPEAGGGAPEGTIGECPGAARAERAVRLATDSGKSRKFRLTFAFDTRHAASKRAPQTPESWSRGGQDRVALRAKRKSLSAMMDGRCRASFILSDPKT